MKTIMRKITSRSASAVRSVKDKVSDFHQRAVSGHTGEGYIDTAVKILIAVVLGALLLAGLYALFNDTVMPTMTKRIIDMFNYAGGLH